MKANSPTILRLACLRKHPSVHFSWAEASATAVTTSGSSSWAEYFECLRKSREKVVEGFGERRVREDAFAEGGKRELAHHGDLQHGHDFAPFDAKNGGAENLLRLRIDDCFEKAARLVHFQ